MRYSTNYINSVITLAQDYLADLVYKMHSNLEMGKDIKKLRFIYKELIVLAFALENWEQNSDGTTTDDHDTANSITLEQRDKIISRIRKIADGECLIS